MNLCFKMNNSFDFTPVSNIFIDEYIKDANPSFVSVYLIALRCYYSLNDIDTRVIAECSGLLESDVIRAFQYWNEKGVVKIDEDENQSLIIAFNDLKESAIRKQVEENVIEKKKVQITAKAKERPTYSNDEMQIISAKNPEISQIFKMAEKSFCKPLTGNDMNVLLSLYDWYDLPLEVIAVLITYCSEKNKSTRYIEKVAIDWTEKGINSEERATEYINLINNDYKEIMEAFGIYGATPVAKQKDFMYKWTCVYKLSMELILEAASRAVLGTGKPKFEYADKVLTSWYEKNVQTMEDVKRVDEEFKGFNKNNKPNYQKIGYNNTNSQVSKYASYSQREIDDEKMRDIENQILNKTLKEMGK